MTPRPLPEWLPADKIKDLIAAADGELRVWLHLAWASGGRVKELTTDLTWDRLRLGEEPCVFLKGKGGDERRVPLYHEAAEALKEWQQSQHGGPQVFSFTTQGIRDRLKAFGRRHGHPGLHPHVIRHSFGSALYSGGADLISLRDLMGHRDVMTTLIYVHESTPRLDRLRRSVTVGLPRALKDIIDHPHQNPDLRPHREGP